MVQEAQLTIGDMELVIVINLEVDPGNVQLYTNFQL